jgi:hypothetical protein
MLLYIWGQLSILIYEWQQSNYNDARWGKFYRGASGMKSSVLRAGINNPYEALDIIDFLERPRPP